MRRIIALTVLAMLSAGLAAQTATEGDYLKKMEALVGRVGYDGIGVETLLTKWEADFPDSPDMLSYKFNYYFLKCQKSEVVAKGQERFLGQKPLISLKDSLGADVNYFQEIMYDDVLFGSASQAIDRLIRVQPDELQHRFTKISSLISYEKESPDMASSTMKGLIDYNYSSKPSWKAEGKPVTQDDFSDAVKDICFTFYTIGSPAGYEAFRSVSEKMLSYRPKDAGYISNIGSYYLVYKNDSAQALKYYNKALKISPGNVDTIKNCILIARRDKNAKLEKKYLAMLLNCTTDEIEKASAQSRLDYLGRK